MRYAMTTGRYVDHSQAE